MHKNKIYLYGKGYDMNSSVSRTPKSIFSVTLLAIFAMAGFTVAQTTDDELKDHPEYTASGYLVYPEPDKSVKYTKAPAGYKPFYISHYGRHGSRYHYSADDYNYLFETLAKADSAKALSVTGKYIMLSSKLLADKAASRAGDLTQKGVKQHEGIAMRMAKNFPDVFKSKNAKIAEVNAKGKQVKKNVKLPPQVDAFASTSGRCIVSMSAFVGGLKSQVPTAQIRMESSKSLMGHINTFNFDITKNYAETPEFKAENDKLWKDISTDNFVRTIFADTAYVSKNVDVSNLYNKMFEIAGSIQGMEDDNDLIIFDRLFPKEEKIKRWKAQNAWWYSILGTCPLTGNDGINTAKPILKHIMSETENAIAGATDADAATNTVATLRFGHDTGLLPLAGLMQLSVANAKVTDLSKLHEQWTDFRIIPMAANLQMIFYKKPGAKPAKGAAPEILVKFLYNEREVTAPIPCGDEPAQEPAQVKADIKPGMVAAQPAAQPAAPGVMLPPPPAKKVKCPAAPYYRWEDVKNFYGKILAE